MHTRIFVAALAQVRRLRIRRQVAVALSILFVSVVAWGQASAQGLSVDQMQKLFGQGSQQGSGSGGDAQSQTPTQTMLEPAAPLAGPLPKSRLEKIMSERAGVELKQFGYKELGVGRSVSIPRMGAVQDDYVLGPGDEIVVSMRGQENSQYRTEVTRNGVVLLPKLPPISAAGRTFGDFRRDVAAAIARAYVATQGYVSLGNMRQISVFVTGDVGTPGMRIMTGLTTPADAILISGGIKKAGSLRNVKLIHNGHTTTIDLYDLITQGGVANRTLLADGDRIVVPPLGPTVAVVGWVRHPGIYELPPGGAAISVRGLEALAGGMEVRGKYRISVLRVARDGQTVMTPGNEGSELHDSDVLYVLPAAAQSISKATLSGGTALAGRYPITRGTKLSDIIKSPGALGESPYTLLGVISRRDPTTYLRELVAFSPVAVLNGTEDMDLKTDDVVRVFSFSESQMLRKTLDRYRRYQLAIEEAVRNPETAASGELNKPFNFEPQQGQNAADWYDNQGNNGQQQGNENGANQPQDLQRQAANLRAIQQYYDQQSGSQQQGSSGAGNQPGISSGPESSGVASLNAPLTAGRTQTFVESRLPQNFQGLQQAHREQSEVGQNFQREVAPEGGQATNLEAKSFWQVASQLGVAQLVLANFLTDHLVHVSGAVRGPGTYLVGPDVSLADVVKAAGGTLNWADDSGVELTTTQVDSGTGQAVTRRVSLALHKGMLANYTVLPHDDFRFREAFTAVNAGSVTLQGQVRFPGTYQILRGERLSDILVRAGGLTDVAYPYGTVFLRHSAALIEQASYKRAANEIENQLLVGLTARSSNQLSPDTFTALQGFVTQLRDTKPLGRVSVVADPSVLLAHPSEDMLLEPGDVIYIPQRPSMVAVLGRVLQPGSFPFRSGRSVEDYISEAGGYAQFADDGDTFIVLPDGTARHVESSWLNFNEPNIPPGSAIVVPRDLAPLDLHQLVLDTTSIMSQLAVSAASLAVLSKQ